MSTTTNEMKFSTLANLIDESCSVKKTINEDGETVYEDIEKKEYNTSAKNSLKKEWNGNIKLFATNPLQYKKRFHKANCCENSMVEWKQGNDSISICKECGFIDENNSHVSKIEEEREDMFNGMEKEIFFGEENSHARLNARSTKSQEKQEPTEEPTDKEIIVIEKQLRKYIRSH